MRIRFSGFWKRSVQYGSFYRQAACRPASCGISAGPAGKRKLRVVGFPHRRTDVPGVVLLFPLPYLP